MTNSWKYFLSAVLSVTFITTVHADKSPGDDASSHVWGNWALQMPDGAAGWLTLQETNGNPEGQLWTVGGGKQLTNVSIEGNKLSFVRHIKVGPAEFEGGPPTGDRVASESAEEDQPKCRRGAVDRIISAFGVNGDFAVGFIDDLDVIWSDL